MSGSRALWRYGAVLAVFAGLLGAQPVNPDIHVNNATGTNGQASGAPSGSGAIFKASCCHTGGVTTSTISCPSHGMGGLPTNGSAALWIETSSGRRWSKITGFPNGDQITVQDNFNISGATPVNCAAGGKIAGTLANVTRLCADMRQGWTITIEQTGADYTDSGSCALAPAGTLTTDGRMVIQGDDADNPPTINYQSNASYISADANTSLKLQNLHIVRNAAGSSGTPIALANAGGVIRNVHVEQTVGQWTEAWSTGGTPGTVLESSFVGPFVNNCNSPDDEDLIVANFFDGCNGSTAIAAFHSPLGVFLFNLIRNGGANTAIFDSSTNNGAGSIRLYNTLLEAGGTGLRAGANFTSYYSGNLIGDEASTLAGACWDVGSPGAALLGASGFGSPSNFWGGNAADQCPTARYSGGLSTSALGAATDILAGAQLDPALRDPLTLDFFPLSGQVKSALVFPGSSFPLLTPALPISTFSAGAAQRFTAEGPGEYAY